MTDGVRGVRVQLLPWRLRWRTKDPDIPGTDLWPDTPDDLLGALALLVVTDLDGDRRVEEVTGTRAMLARRRALRALRAAA